MTAKVTPPFPPPPNKPMLRFVTRLKKEDNKVFLSNDILVFRDENNNNDEYRIFKSLFWTGSWAEEEYKR